MDDEIEKVAILRLTEGDSSNIEDITTDNRIIITSGRISSEILLKAAKRNIPILISKSAPADLGVKLANDLGITLLGFVRGKRINAYTNHWRVVRDGK